MRRPFPKIHKYMQRYEKVRQETHHTNETAFIITEEQIARETGQNFYKSYNSFRDARVKYHRQLRRQGKIHIQIFVSNSRLRL